MIRPAVRTSSRVIPILRWIMAAFYVVAGAAHFVNPGIYLELMPPSVPWPLPLIYLSGGAEIVLGFGVLIAGWRKLSGWGIIALLVAVFPANLHAALHGFRSIPEPVLWARLPFQLILIWWAYACCIAAPRQRG